MSYLRQTSEMFKPYTLVPENVLKLVQDFLPGDCVVSHDRACMDYALIKFADFVDVIPIHNAYTILDIIKLLQVTRKITKFELLGLENKSLQIYLKHLLHFAQLRN